MEEAFFMRNTNTKTYKLVVTALLSALVIVMAFTPLGFLKVGAVEISFLMLPVAIGAVTCGFGPAVFLALLFGVASFIQCFGMSALGVFLMTLNPAFCFITCVVARLIAGVIAGLVAKATRKIGVAGYILTGLSAACANTIFFVGAIILFFFGNDAFQTQMTEWGISTENAWLFACAFATTNCLIEAAATAFLTGAVGAALKKAGFIKTAD